MKVIFLSAALLVLLIFGGRDVGAQIYQPYAYEPYWAGIEYQPYPYPQYYDPYYSLHVMHYQLYIQPYPGYPFYQPCCVAGSIVPVLPRPLVTAPRVIIAPHSRHGRRR